MQAPTVGQPTTFTSGTFAGRVLRAELKEIQHATRGRKFYAQDRRPLDPPPVAELFLYEILHTGTTLQMELPVTVTEAEPIVLPGFICHVDLFPIDGPGIAEAARRPPDGRPTTWQRSRPGDNPDILAYVEGCPITQSSCCTQQLAGERFSSLYQNFTQLMFAYGDLSCCQDGHFILRYRVFDLYSMRPGAPIPILAECYGHPFRVYEAREFPGLEASTELTRVLQQRGVRVTVRDNVTRRRRRSPEEEGAE